MVGLDQAERVLQDCLRLLDDRIGRQAALAFAQTHRSARGVEAQSHDAGGLDRVVQPAAVGEDVQVVGGGGAAAERQLRQPQHRRGADVLWLHPRPDRIERLEPREQSGVLGSGHRPGQRLVQVVVGVDQAGQDDVVVQVEDLVRRRGKFRRWAHLFDPPVTGKQAGIAQLAPAVVHGQQDRRVPDEKGGHGVPGTHFAGRCRNCLTTSPETQDLAQNRQGRPGGPSLGSLCRLRAAQAEAICAPRSVLAIRPMIVIGPTPPGTGVMAPATSSASS